MIDPTKVYIMGQSASEIGLTLLLEESGTGYEDAIRIPLDEMEDLLDAVASAMRLRKIMSEGK